MTDQQAACRIKRFYTVPKKQPMSEARYAALLAAYFFNHGGGYSGQL